MKRLLILLSAVALLASPAEALELKWTHAAKAEAVIYPVVFAGCIILGGMPLLIHHCNLRLKEYVDRKALEEQSVYETPLAAPPSPVKS